MSLASYPGSQFRRRKSAVKLHTLLDLRGSIPTSVYVTGGQVHDVNLLDELLLEAGAFYLLDRGYVDFARLYAFTQSLCLLRHSPKKNLQFYRALLASGGTVHRRTVRSDHRAHRSANRQRYPDPLRRIAIFDPEKDLRLTCGLLFDFNFLACFMAP